MRGISKLKTSSKVTSCYNAVGNLVKDKWRKIMTKKKRPIVDLPSRLRALIHIKCNPGTEYDLCDELKKIEAITRVQLITGEWNIVVTADSNNANELGLLIVNEIEKSEKVMGRTRTVVVLHSWTRPSD